MKHLLFLEHNSTCFFINWGRLVIKEGVDLGHYPPNPINNFLKIFPMTVVSIGQVSRLNDLQIKRSTQNCIVP